MLEQEKVCLSRRDLLLVRFHRVKHDVGQAVASLGDRVVIAVDLPELVWFFGDQLLENLVVLVLLEGVALREDDDVRNLALFLLLLDDVLRQAGVLGVLELVVSDHLIEGLAQEVEVELLHDHSRLSVVADLLLDAVHLPDSPEELRLLLDEVGQLVALSLIVDGASRRLAKLVADLKNLEPQFGVLLAVHVDVGILVDIDHLWPRDLLSTALVLLEELRLVLTFNVLDIWLGSAIWEDAFAHFL